MNATVILPAGAANGLPCFQDLGGDHGIIGDGHMPHQDHGGIIDSSIREFMR